jgi:hypothetical protein
MGAESTRTEERRKGSVRKYIFFLGSTTRTGRGPVIPCSLENVINRHVVVGVCLT